MLYKRNKTIQTILKMANQCHVFANQLTFQVQIVKRKSMSTLVSCGDSLILVILRLANLNPNRGFGV